MIHRIQAKNIRTLSKPSKNSGILLRHAVFFHVARKLLTCNLYHVATTRCCEGRDGPQLSTNSEFWDNFHKFSKCLKDAFWIILHRHQSCSVPCEKQKLWTFRISGKVRKLSALQGRRLRSIFGSFGSLQELKPNFSSDSGNTEMYMAIAKFQKSMAVRLKNEL